MMKPKRTFATMLAALVCFGAVPATASAPQRPFYGRWLIAEAHPAPWNTLSDPGTAPFDDHVRSNCRTMTEETHSTRRQCEFGQHFADAICDRYRWVIRCRRDFKIGRVAGFVVENHEVRKGSTNIDTYC